MRKRADTRSGRRRAHGVLTALRPVQSSFCTSQSRPRASAALRSGTRSTTFDRTLASPQEARCNEGHAFPRSAPSSRARASLAHEHCATDLARCRPPMPLSVEQTATVRCELARIRHAAPTTSTRAVRRRGSRRELTQQVCGQIRDNHGIDVDADELKRLQASWGLDVVRKFEGRSIGPAGPLTLDDMLHFGPEGVVQTVAICTDGRHLHVVSANRRGGRFRLLLRVSLGARALGHVVPVEQLHRAGRAACSILRHAPRPHAAARSDAMECSSLLAGAPAL